MKLVSVNVAMPKTVDHLGRKVSTGIYNEPVTGRVMVRKLNVDGDGQADLTVHGGVYKAVYVYGLENIHSWRQELGRDDLGYGHFGENFTVEEPAYEIVFSESGITAKLSRKFRFFAQPLLISTKRPGSTF